MTDNLLYCACWYVDVMCMQVSVIQWMYVCMYECNINNF